MEIIEVGIGRMHDFGWRHVIGDGTMRFIDSEFAHVIDDGAEAMFLLTAPIDGGFFGCELNEVVRTNGGGTLENIESSDGDTPEEAEMSCCFWAAAQGIFNRLDELEMNCEDAVNRLAYESAALYECCAYACLNPRTLDKFLGLARDYIREQGPSVGIEWVEF